MAIRLLNDASVNSSTIACISGALHHPEMRARRTALFEEQHWGMLIVRFPLFMVLASGLNGCASWSAPTVQPAAVSPDQYLGMTCQQLKNEKWRIASRQTDLAPTLIPVADEQKRE